MIRILMADDHPIVRAGLRAVLSGESDIEVVADVSEAAVAVELAARGGVDLVLMDLQFGGGEAGVMQGADATRRIRALPDAPPVLVLTNYDTDADILGAIEAGASGYLLKDAPPSELIAAARAAAAGASALAPTVQLRLDERRNTVSAKLTLRETEVLELVAIGRSNREIGQRLFLSEATVKSHLVHIFTKLDVSSRTSAVATARARGIIRSN